MICLLVMQIRKAVVLEIAPIRHGFLVTRSHLHTTVLMSLYYTSDLILGDDALLYTAYVMLTWAAPIRAARWHCSLRS